MFEFCLLTFRMTSLVFEKFERHLTIKLVLLQCKLQHVASMDYLVLLTDNLLIISCQLISDGGSSNSLLDASNRFYTLIPHDFGMKKPPLLDNLELIQVKLGAHVRDFPSTLGNDRNVSACVRR